MVAMASLPCLPLDLVIDADMPNDRIAIVTMATSARQPRRKR